MFLKGAPPGYTPLWTGSCIKHNNQHHKQYYTNYSSLLIYNINDMLANYCNSVVLDSE